MTNPPPTGPAPGPRPFAPLARESALVVYFRSELLGVVARLFAEHAAEAGQPALGDLAARITGETAGAIGDGQDVSCESFAEAVRALIAACTDPTTEREAPTEPKPGAGTGAEEPERSSQPPGPGRPTRMPSSWSGRPARRPDQLDPPPAGPGAPAA